MLDDAETVWLDEELVLILIVPDPSWLMIKSTWSAVSEQTSGVGVDLGVGVAVGDGLGVDVGDGVGVDEGVGVGLPLTPPETGVGVGEGVVVPSGVALGSGVGVGVPVAGVVVVDVAPDARSVT